MARYIDADKAIQQIRKQCNEEYYEGDLLLGGNDFPNYCPHCGAKMDEEVDA